MSAIRALISSGKKVDYLVVVHYLCSTKLQLFLCNYFTIYYACQKKREIQTCELNGAWFFINEMRRQSHLVVVKSCCLSAMHEYNMWSQCEGDYSPLNRCKKEWTSHSSLCKYYNHAILNIQQGQGFRNDLLKNTRWCTRIFRWKIWAGKWKSVWSKNPEGRCELSSLCPWPQVTPGGQSGQWVCWKMLGVKSSSTVDTETTLKDVWMPLH